MLHRALRLKLISAGIVILTLLSIDYSLAWKNWNWLKEHIFKALFK